MSARPSSRERLLTAEADLPRSNLVQPAPERCAVGVCSKLTVEEVAEWLRCSPWTVWDWARKGEIPHRKPPGKRRLLFDLRELEAWQDGAQLEIKRLPNGGRVVRPRWQTQSPSAV